MIMRVCMKLRFVKSLMLICLPWHFIAVLFLCLWMQLVVFGGEVDDVAGNVAPEQAEITTFGDIAVVGGNQKIRAGIASTADKLRVGLNRICGEAPTKKMSFPIIIKLYGAEGDKDVSRSMATKISNLQDQYQLLLNIHLGRGVDQDMLRYHLVELLLYERGLADSQLLEKGERLIVRPWLIVGILEAMDLRSGNADRRLYHQGIDFLSILPLEQVFEASEREWLEMIGRQPIAFRAISGAIVNALLRQPGGKSSMATYLAEFATFRGEYENLLRQHFPGMNQSSSSLDKWVNLELMELGTARVTQVHSILETEARLESVLKLRYRDESGSATQVDIALFDKVMGLELTQRMEAVASSRAELERLSYRCFPTYRPILLEYESILRDIVAGEDKKIISRLAKLMDVRMKMKSAAIRARDYLDWFYITQSNEVSGDFEKYRDLMDALEKEERRSPHGDTTSKYLDGVQRFYGAGR